jgi:GT2 family glycosyltransferase
LDQQVTNGLFDVSIAVVDNDANESARGTVEVAAQRSMVPIAYAVEPRQSIALARNASVEMASGTLVAFIDDDEIPARDWLLKLYDVLVEYGVDGVLGPVVPTFSERSPAWAVKSGVFMRPNFETGKLMDASTVGIGNALMKREVLLELGGPFRPEFGAGGEDRDLLHRAISKGRIFVWAADAVCQEPVTPERMRVKFQVRRALLRGKVALHGPGGGWLGVMKSVIAVPLYVMALPICLIMGPHVFVAYLIRAFDHVGKVLASCGIDLVGDKYITQ